MDARDAAPKLHVPLDLRGPLPALLAVTPPEHTDLEWLNDLPIETGSYYVMDCGYVDSRSLYRIADADAFSAIRKRSDDDGACANDSFSRGE